MKILPSKLLALIVFSIIIGSPQANANSLDSIPKFIIGNEIGGRILNVNESISPDKQWFYSIRNSPYLAIPLSKRLYIGASIEHTFSDEDFEPDIIHYFGYGAFCRYNFYVSKGKVRIKGYSELSFNRTNYSFASGENVKTDNIDQNYLRLSAGVNIPIYRGIHLDLGVRPQYEIGANLFLSPRLGIEYHFGSYKKD